MADLLSIIYVSSAVNPFSDVELNELLIGARSFNRAHSITGMLLYTEGNFIQCLEGTSDSVLAAYNRIRVSRRHKGLIELNRTEIKNRSFESWEMGLSQPNAAEFISISNALSLASEKDNSSVITIEFMKAFVSTMRAV